MSNIWVDASFKHEAIEDPLGTINIKFSLPKDDLGGIEEMEELAAAKAQEYLKKMSNLMNDAAMLHQANIIHQPRS